MEGIRIYHRGQIDVTDSTGKGNCGTEAVQRNHPGANAAVNDTLTEPQHGTGNHQHSPRGKLKGNVHALAAIIESLLGHIFRVHTDKFHGELHEEGNILAVELKDFREHAPDTFPRRNQPHNGVKYKDYGKEAMRILQGRRPEHIIEETEGIRIQGQSRQKQHKEADGVNPMQIDKAFRMAFDVVFIHQHLICPPFRALPPGQSGRAHRQRRRSWPPCPVDALHSSRD